MKRSLIKNRAWIEINLENLEFNIKEIKKLITKKTKIMAVIKANAYGHDSIFIARKLSSMGITDFAVASLEEAITLRKNKIQGNILILGFTNFNNLKYVIKYDLIQTIIDYNYSEKIKTLNLKEKLKCHIKINTGMNRIGEEYDNFDKLYKIYENKKLNILGTYSHLCVSDSKDSSDIEFTKRQISNFDSCVKHLKKCGYNVGKLHIQNSYGILNYPNLNYDYVRVGIFMYGTHSFKSSYKLKNINLKPVIKLKARIISIRKLNKGDSVGYGRLYVAPQNKLVATVSIGYADGLPRNLSSKDMLVKVNDEYAKVIGKICMDQLMIDISNIPNVKIGDIVVLIDEDEKISVERLSESDETITNELLSRLGNRLRRIVI